ncbi:hypothetical protein D3C73_1437780 [compost metagenome]
MEEMAYGSIGLCIPAATMKGKPAASNAVAMKPKWPYNHRMTLARPAPSSYPNGPSTSKVRGTVIIRESIGERKTRTDDGVYRLKSFSVCA